MNDVDMSINNYIFLDIFYLDFMSTKQITCINNEQPRNK